MKKYIRPCTKNTVRLFIAQSILISLSACSFSNDTVAERPGVTQLDGSEFSGSHITILAASPGSTQKNLSSAGMPSDDTAKESIDRKSAWCWSSRSTCAMIELRERTNSGES